MLAQLSINESVPAYCIYLNVMLALLYIYTRQCQHESICTQMQTPVNSQALPARKGSFNDFFCESEAHTEQACQCCAASIGRYTPVTPNMTDSRHGSLKYGLSGSQVQNPWFPRTNSPSTNQHVFVFCTKYRKHSRGQIPGEDRPAGMASGFHLLPMSVVVPHVVQTAVALEPMFVVLFLQCLL